MSKLFETSEVQDILRNAFVPFKCEPKLQDHGEIIEIVVYVPVGEPLSQSFSVDELRNPETLRVRIMVLRNQLRQMNLLLSRWSMPPE